MVADAHNDFLTAVKDKAEREQIVKDFVKNGVKVLSCAVFTTEQQLKIEDIESFDKEIKEYNKKYNCNFLLSIEDIGFVKSKSDLDRLIKLKPISVTLTWNFNNQFTGGALDNGGFTKLGKSVVKILEQNNILVDTAHLNKKSFWQFVKISSKPIYCSHANIFSLRKHKRNLTNKQIEKIFETNGFLGLTLYQDFVSNGQIKAEHIAKQFAYLSNKHGSKNFGFGTDFFGSDRDKFPKDVTSYADFKHIEKALKIIKFTGKTIAYITHKNYIYFLQAQGIDLKNFKG